MAALNTPACFSLTKIYHQNCSLETASSWRATALKIPLQKKHPEPHNGTQPQAAQNDGALCHFERPWFHPWQMGWHQRVREFLSFTSRQCELWLTGKSRSLSVMIFSSKFNHFYLIYCLLCIHVYTWGGGGSHMHMCVERPEVIVGVFNHYPPCFETGSLVEPRAFQCG